MPNGCVHTAMDFINQSDVPDIHVTDLDAPIKAVFDTKVFFIELLYRTWRFGGMRAHKQCIREILCPPCTPYVPSCHQSKGDRYIYAYIRDIVPPNCHVMTCNSHYTACGMPWQCPNCPCCADHEGRLLPVYREAGCLCRLTLVVSSGFAICTYFLL